MGQQRGRVRVEQSEKRVRTYFGGELIADSAHVLMVWERPYYPVYYFPVEDVAMEHLTPTGDTRRSPSRGEAHIYTIKVGVREAASAAWTYPDSPIEELQDHMRFDWAQMDAWFEEDEEVFVHARDPYTRIDILHSSRHIEVKIGDVTVADSYRPTLLFETGMPTRYYLPKVDVRMDLLQATDLLTSCPYKGDASYWGFTVNEETYENYVWTYKFPTHESANIAGLVSFYNEKVDIYVDGELQARPTTVFS